MENEFDDYIFSDILLIVHLGVHRKYFVKEWSGSVECPLRTVNLLIIGLHSLGRNVVPLRWRLGDDGNVFVSRSIIANSDFSWVR